MTDQSIDHFEGPSFHTLNEDFQMAMYVFLSERGIDDVLTETLGNLAQVKEQMEYTQWLAKTEEFLLYDPTKAAPPKTMMKGKDAKQGAPQLKKKSGGAPRK